MGTASSSRIAGDPAPAADAPPVAVAGHADLAAAVAEVETFELAPLPRVAHQLTALAQDANVDLARFVELLKTDPATASGVLRAASSTAFAAKVPIASLTQAVSRLGLQSVAQIALTVAVRARFVQVKGYERDIEADYRCSVAIALFAQRIARARKLNAEEAFLAGLLSDVGRPAILTTLAKHLPAALAPHRAADVRAFLDLEHAAVGKRLLAQWKLPEALCEAAAAHHDAEPPTPLAAIVWLADALARRALSDARDATACADVDAGQASDEGAAIDASAIADSPAAAVLNLYAEDVIALGARAAEIRAKVEVL